jgi:hypothetical protein
MLQKCFGKIPHICALTQSCLGALRTIPLNSWLGFCSDKYGNKIGRCVPFQIMSDQINLPQIESSQVEETSQGMSESKQDATELNFESHIKGSEYMCK